MHGRPRKALEPEKEAASAAEALELRSLLSRVMSNHHQKVYTQEAFDLSTKLLVINPEVYTVWNYRKLAVEDKLSRIDSDLDLVKQILDEELSVVKSALKKNSKSYGAWYHRKWVLSKRDCSIIANDELRDLDVLLKEEPEPLFVEVSKENKVPKENKNARNFHAWNYRRFVVELASRSEQDELQYTKDTIFNNDKNYSAWHYCSVLVSSLLAKKADGFMIPNDVICEEYGFAQEFILVAPGEQSSWFYYLWLLNQTVNVKTPCEFVFTARVHDNVEESLEGIVSWTDGFDDWDAQSKDLISLVALDQLDADTGFEWRKEAIEKEIKKFRGMLFVAGKIGKLTLARLLMASTTMISDDALKGVYYEEILEFYNDLMTLDSSHYQYYKDMHSEVFLHKVTTSIESLSRHLFWYKNDMKSLVCLRLNNLSLSRIATFEKLKFVQMLDLSHNELHSTEGLEVMQLLSCLNLSHNRIRSFSALDTLKHLKQLRVLNVSYNHIGKHSVDTTRYLCSSPLSNSVYEWTSLVTKYWDAYSVLRDLNLKQLDIEGNVIAGEEFSSFVRGVMPKLVWLDGHTVQS